MENNSRIIGSEVESRFTAQPELMNVVPIAATPLTMIRFEPQEDRLYADVVVPSLKIVIKDALREAKKRLKRMSLEEASKQILVARSEAKRQTTTFAGQERITFVIPEELPFSIEELDKLASYEFDNDAAYRFSFSQRIHGWIMERRQRMDRKFDLFFLHEKSQKMFRSSSEVENFVLYNKYPRRKGHEPSQKEQNNRTINDASKEEAVEIVDTFEIPTTDSDDESIGSFEFKRRKVSAWLTGRNPEI